MEFSDFKKYDSFILRVGLGLVFLYFSFQQMVDPVSWSGYVPDLLVFGYVGAENWVIFNSVIELCLGSFLILGIYTRFSALVLGIHLLFITISVGFNPTGVRDFGLTIATLLLFLKGGGIYSIDRYFKLKA